MDWQSWLKFLIAGGIRVSERIIQEWDEIQDDMQWDKEVT